MLETEEGRPAEGGHEGIHHTTIDVAVWESDNKQGLTRSEFSRSEGRVLLATLLEKTLMAFLFSCRIKA